MDQLDKLTESQLNIIYQLAIDSRTTSTDSKAFKMSVIQSKYNTLSYKAQDEIINLVRLYLNNNIYLTEK